MRTIHRVSATVAAAALAVVLVPAAASADPPPFVFPGGCCFYEGTTVRTVVPPASFPREGTDDFFAVVGGVSGQKAIVAVVPGDDGYRGGHWAFHRVTWNVAPYLLDSDDAVVAAAAAGAVAVTRVPENDFRCPIQP